MRITLFCLMAVIFAVSAFLTTAGAQNDVDLDGDGKPDRIVFEGKPGGDTFAITVNNVRYTGTGECLDGTYAIVDIDSTDGLREIAITEDGPSDDYATTFLRYAAGRFFYMGKIPGSGKMMEIDGSGGLKTTVRGSILHTWFFPAVYVADTNHTLRMVEQTLYPMLTPMGSFSNFSQGTQCTVKRSFSLCASPENLTIVATLNPGDKFTIVASDNKHWCVVQTSLGIWGWFEVIGYATVLPAGVSALELIDGLCMAD